MRKLLATALAVSFLVVSASPAWAGRARVLAGDAAIAWDSGDLCGVFAHDYGDHDVELYCVSSGSAWVKIRVPGVQGAVTRVVANGDGDCSGKSVTYVKRGTVVKVKIRHTGDFDCTYTAIVVRYS